MKVLITGGAGFIGSHFAARCLQEGHEVIIIDNLSAGYIENIPRGSEIIHLDISDDHFIEKLNHMEVDAIAHLAAQASGEISYEQPVYDLKTNTMGTLQLLKWAHENDLKKFIYTSSMTVYGDGHEGPLKETDSLAPKSFYSVGKCASEQYITIFNDMGLDTTVLRLFNVYGPGQNMNNMKQGMISIYMAYIAQHQPIVVKGSLERFRDFVYIDDVVEALYLSMISKKSTGRTFNVCTGRKTCVSALLDMIINSFGETPGKYPIEVVGPTPRDQFGAYGNNSLINSTLGWNPKTDLETGINLMTEWVQTYYSKK